MLYIERRLLLLEIYVYMLTRKYILVLINIHLFTYFFCISRIYDDFSW